MRRWVTSSRSTSSTPASMPGRAPGVELTLESAKALRAALDRAIAAAEFEEAEVRGKGAVREPRPGGVTIPMRAGEIVFTGMDRVVFGRPAAEAVAEAADRLGARRVFILASATLNRETDAVRRIAAALGSRYAGVHDEMPAHSPRDAVVACANKAREAGCDLLVSVGGGSTTDGGKAVTICLEHDIREPDGLEPFRTVVDEITGKRSFPRVPRAAGPPDLRADHPERRRIQRPRRRHRAAAAAEAGLHPSRHHPARGDLRSGDHRAHAGMAVALDRHPRGRSCGRDLLLDRRQRLHRQHRAAGAAPARPRAAGGEARSGRPRRRGSTARSAPGSR